MNLINGIEHIFTDKIFRSSGGQNIVRLINSRPNNRENYALHSSNPPPQDVRLTTFDENGNPVVVTGTPREIRKLLQRR